MNISKEWNDMAIKHLNRDVNDLHLVTEQILKDECVYYDLLSAERIIRNCIEMLSE